MPLEHGIGVRVPDPEQWQFSDTASIMKIDIIHGDSNRSAPRHYAGFCEGQNRVPDPEPVELVKIFWKKSIFQKKLP